MFSFFKKKKIVPHIRLSGVIGNVGKFKQGIDFSGQEEIISKAFSLNGIKELVFWNVRFCMPRVWNNLEISAFNE